MLNQKNELKLVVFAFIFSLAIILSTSVISYRGTIINFAYGILLVSFLLIVKILLDKRKVNKK